jgi:hypothetical protein
VERTFSAIGHGLLIPLFFVSIGLTSNFRALGGHWLLFGVIFFIAVISKMIGCGLAAMARGMGWVPSLRIGCGMVSRGEVGLIIAAIAVRTRAFRESEVAMIVAVVLLTTLLTPLALRGAFHLKCPQDDADLSGGMEDFLQPSSPEQPFERLEEDLGGPGSSARQAPLASKGVSLPESQRRSRWISRRPDASIFSLEQPPPADSVH